VAGVSGSSGDMNLNRPVLWPSGKPQGQISRGNEAAEAVGATAEMGQVKEGVSQRQPITLSPQATAALTQTTGATPAAVVQAFPLLKSLVSEPYSLQHLVNILLALGLTATSENLELVARMIRNGVTLTKENLSFIKAAVLFARGVSPDISQDAAMILLSRGLNSFPSAFNALIAFLGENPRLAEQLVNLQNLLTTMQEAMNRGQNLSADLVARLAALVQGWEGTAEKISKNQLNRENLVNNTRALRSLLAGLGKSLNSTSGAATAEVIKQVQESAEQVGRILQNLVAAVVLSLPKVNADSSFPNYYYAQIPNLMGPGHGTLDIMVKRDETHPKKKINPRKTVIILGLEALALGQLVIEMSVEERNVDFKFKIALDEANNLIKENLVNLRDRLETEGFTARKVEVITTPKEEVKIEKYLFPEINLTDLRRIVTEA
jgi:uncharacterized protein YukE